MTAVLMVMRKPVSRVPPLVGIGSVPRGDNHVFEFSGELGLNPAQSRKIRLVVKVPEDEEVVLEYSSATNVSQPVPMLRHTDISLGEWEAWSALAQGRPEPGEVRGKDHQGGR